MEMYSPAKEQLLAQLKALHTTMMEVHNRNEHLDMSNWITELSGTKEDGWCGSVACWCGWQALGNLDNFPRAKAQHQSTPENLGKIALKLSEDLDETCRDVFLSSELAVSIYGALVDMRREDAEDSELFSKEELNHPHLNKEPTPLEAASYAMLCIEKVKAHGESSKEQVA